MTADEFLQWCVDQGKDSGRWELVDGLPVLAMAGATNAHDTVTVNLIRHLGNALAGGPCRPHSADQAVKTSRAQRVRRPDVLVSCTPRGPRSLHVEEPVVLFEVISPSTANVVRSAKVQEYQALESVRHIALVEQDQPLVRLYSRAANDAWTLLIVTGLEGELDLPAINVRLAMADVYADVSFDDEDRGEV